MTGVSMVSVILVESVKDECYTSINTQVRCALETGVSVTPMTGVSMVSVILVESVKDECYTSTNTQFRCALETGVSERTGSTTLVLGVNTRDGC